MIGLGNPNAINLNKRATSNQEDLNRCFTTVSEETTKNSYTIFPMKNNGH